MAERLRTLVVETPMADADGAGGELHAHLEFLRPYSERAWCRPR